jgi:hypothetical protein
MKQNEQEGSLPGEDLVEQGLIDLANDKVTDASLLVLIAAPRLKRLGIHVPERSFPQPYEHELYERLHERLGTAAHSYYNSLIRRMVSYAQSLERECSQQAQREKK